MNCRDAIDRLHASLDAGGAPDAGLEAHLAECSSCRAAHAELIAVEEALAAAACEAVPPRGLHAGIMNRLRTAAPEFARPSRTGLPGWFSLAAAGVLAVSIAAFYRAPEPPRPGPATEAPSDGAAARELPHLAFALPDPVRAIEERGRPYRELARTFAATAASPLRGAMREIGAAPASGS